MGSVNSYLDGSVTQFSKAILIGAAIPLVAYLVWQLATHGVLSQNEFVQVLQADPTLNGLRKRRTKTKVTQTLDKVTVVWRNPVKHPI